MTWTAWRHILPGRAPVEGPYRGPARAGSRPSRVRLPQEGTLSEVGASCHYNFPNYSSDKSFRNSTHCQDTDSADLKRRFKTWADLRFRRP